jgi:glutathione synthase/RimK-type ligase-like ATP-grasp enzyme
MNTLIKKKKSITVNSYRPKIRTKNSSAEQLKPEYKQLKAFSIKSVVRLGSTTSNEEVFKTLPTKLVEINSVDAVNTSRSKLLMKKAFDKAGVKTSEWFTFYNDSNGYLKICSKEDNVNVPLNTLPYPIIAKKIFGQKGIGMQLIKNIDEMQTFIKDVIVSGLNKTRYYLESYYNYNREYRLHVTNEGCFYTCRKVLKNDAKERWFRNDSNCNWLVEENSSFDKPVNWDMCIKHSILALQSVGLDIGAVDLKIQSSTTSKGEIRTNPEFIIIEINSAPSFGKITEEKYIEQLNKLIKNKIENLK